jgi:hypothetical protein
MDMVAVMCFELCECILTFESKKKRKSEFSQDLENLFFPLY